MRYLFGDRHLAARRLERLHDVFAAATRPFLLESADTPPALAIDLGCGPGWTTHCLAELLRCERTVGLDNSERFIALAQETATERVSFFLHDVTRVPFPVGPADLLYCRYLLTHMKDPATVMAGWVGELAPGGLLLMEEVEWIRTDIALFVRYLDIVTAMLADQSMDLYVGPELDGFGEAAGLARRESRVRRLKVRNDRAAELFWMNIRTWRHNAFVTTNYPPTEIAALERELRALSEDPSIEDGIEWGLRQAVYERA